MLSILIPSYNYNILPLVKRLKYSAEVANIIFEIIGIDDGSNSILNENNENINSLEYCKFIALKENIGLSNGRNMLADLSHYPNLLFIDGDSLIIDDHYILKYVEELSDDVDIIFGGRRHPEILENADKMLRWAYGKNVEDKLAEIRKKHSYNTLMFNNTVIKKTCFEAIKFEKTLTQYGHEDTLFAYQASLKKLAVKHINNPVEHGDIDTNIVFIKKTNSGLENLKIIYKNNLVDSNFITLLKWHKKLRALKIDYFLALFYSVFKKTMLNNLNSKNPSLFVFKLYKLTYFCNTLKQ